MHSEESPDLPSSSGKPLAHSVAETAAILGISYHTVLRLLKRKKLRAIPHIRHKRIPKTEIERFLRDLS